MGTIAAKIACQIIIGLRIVISWGEVPQTLHQRLCPGPRICYCLKFLLCEYPPQYTRSTASCGVPPLDILYIVRYDVSTLSLLMYLYLIQSSIKMTAVAESRFKTRAKNVPTYHIRSL